MWTRSKVKASSNMPPFFVVVSLAFIPPVLLLLWTLFPFPKHQITVYFLAKRSHHITSCLKFQLRFYSILVWNNEISQILGSLEKLVASFVHFEDDLTIVFHIVVYWIVNVGNFWNIVLLFLWVVKILLQLIPSLVYKD